MITDSFLHQGHAQDVLVLYSDTPLSLNMHTVLLRDGMQKVNIRIRNIHTAHIHAARKQDHKEDSLIRLNNQQLVGYKLHYMQAGNDCILTVYFPRKKIHVSSTHVKNFHDLETTIITFKRMGSFEQHKRDKPLIVIDCGHGGDQPGARGLFGLVEKDVVLILGKKLRDCLQYHGYDVLLTRDADDTVAIDARTSLANKKHATLFISLHNNYALKSQARGIETLFYWENSKQLADFVHEHLIQMPIAGLVNRGVKQALLQVVYGCECPSILVELFFLSNADDARLLQDEQVHKHIVKGLCSAIDQFFKLRVLK